MIKILAILAILLSLLLIVTAPYVAAILYATVSILQPQHVWFWAFTDFSVFKISAGLAILAWSIQMVRGKINWQVYNSGIFYGIVIIGIIYYLSDLLSPFPIYSSRVGSATVIDVYTTIAIMSFITLGLINSQAALKWLVLTLVSSTIYYTFWANSQYFGSIWTSFIQGRLDGPLGSPYGDGNIFSILFVIGMPFVLFAIYHVEKKWQKILLILAIPFIWHALILCASRGAILSAGVSTLMAAWMIKSKFFNIVLLSGFIFFIVDQGGEVISRTTETVNRTENNIEQPIDPRILSWQTGIKLVQKHPILGVGPQRFLEASAFYYPGKNRHVAHNTFLNFSANTGLIAGITYLSFFWVSRKTFKWNTIALKKHPDKFHTYINNSSTCALAGFFVGALFLDLIIFEPFYFLLLIIILNHFLLKQRITSVNADINTEHKIADKNFSFLKIKQTR